MVDIARPENEDGGSWVKHNGDSELYLCSRRGDMLCCPFQCDRCWIVNIKKQEPLTKGSCLSKYLRQANLDIMWSKESSTVKSTLEGTLKIFWKAAELGLQPLATPRGPWPMRDDQGMQLSLQILRQLQEKGQHDESYQQFDSIRRLRSAMFTEYESFACKYAEQEKLLHDMARHPLWVEFPRDYTSSRQVGCQLKSDSCFLSNAKSKVCCICVRWDIFSTTSFKSGVL